LRLAKVEHTLITEENTSQLLGSVYVSDLSQIPKMDKAKRKFILKHMDEYFSG
jgi:hypothetical protein